MKLAPRGNQAPAAWPAAVASLAAVLGLVAGCGSPAVSRAAARKTPAARSSLDAPGGFWSGTDSSYVATPGPAPAREPVIGGAYGGYLGMIGNWASWQGCGAGIVWSPADSASARINFVTYHAGIGVGGYWFMAGPGVDPHYNGSTREATAWGSAQAAQALAGLRHTASPVNYPVIFMDIELPGYAPRYTPVPDNGWTAVYSSPCSGRVTQSYVPADLDRADLNGFAAYLTSHSSYQPGVYSAPSIWTSIFGTSAQDASIPNIYEWTYNGLTTSLSPHPAGWCLSGTRTCAQFFGGQTSKSKYALIWQWSGGGGARNGLGDFDQIDAGRTPTARHRR